MGNYIYKFKIETKQQVIILMPMITFWILIVIIRIYFSKYPLLSIGFIIIFPIIFLIDSLPAIIMHIQYLLKNRKSVLILNTESKELIFESQGKEKLAYSFNDIISLDYYRSYGKGSGWHAFGQYRYYKITFIDKKEIIITCLMINDIENTIEMLLRMGATKHVRLVCFL